MSHDGKGWGGLGRDGADQKSVRVSEAALGDVGVHLRDNVLPFLESYQHLCDLNEVMMTSSATEHVMRQGDMTQHDQKLHTRL